MRSKLTKKEKQLYLQHGKSWDVEIHYYITISRQDSENILKVHGKVIEDHGLVILKRITKRLTLPYGWYLYINKIYGGIDDERVK